MFKRIFTNRKIIVLITVVIFLQFLQIFYFSISLFSHPYDAAYTKDRVEHSQWMLPASRRTIGDDVLFSYVGYTLFHGGNPAGFDAEVPLVGKDLLGLSIVLFHNPYWIEIIFGILSLVCFFFIAKELFQKTDIAFFLPAVLLLEPMFFKQFSITLLDMIQLFFLLGNIMFFLLAINRKKNNTLSIISAGVFLGFFTEIKLPILLPLILVLELFYLTYKKHFIHACSYLASFLFAIGIVYLQYFFHGLSPLSFLKLQKYVFSFYHTSHLQTHIGAVFRILMINQFPDVVTGYVQQVPEWWIVWPVISVLGIFSSIVCLFRKQTPFVWKGIALYTLFSLFVFSIIPVYPRYLILVIPFLYLLSVYWIKLAKKSIVTILLTILLVAGFFNSFFVLIPTVDSTMQSFYYNFSHLYFQDIYQEQLSKEVKKSFTRENFRVLSQGTLENTTVKDVVIKEKGKYIPMFENRGFITAEFVYKTQDLGAFSEEKKIKLIKEQNQWKVMWDWNLLINTYTPADTVSVELTHGKRGAIISNTEAVLAHDDSGFLVSVNPQKIDTKKENSMLAFLGKIGFVKPVLLQNAYLENPLPNTFIPLFSTAENIENEKNVLLSFPGIKVESYRTRIYNRFSPKSITNTFYKECCTRIYSPFSYHGNKALPGPELTYDSNLFGYDGGQIVLKDKQGNTKRILVSKEKKDGKDIQLP